MKIRRRSGRSISINFNLLTTAVGGLLALVVLPEAAWSATPNTPPSQEGRLQKNQRASSVVITLPDAVLIGLRQNRVVKSEYLQRIADRFALYVAEQAFTPKVSLNVSALRSRSFGLEGTNYSVAPDVSWALPTGALLSAGLSNAQSNTAGQPGSAYSQLSFQIIQPLLRGAGTDAATAGLRVSRIQESSNKLVQAQTVIDTVTQIILAYRAVIVSHEQMNIAEEALKRARAESYHSGS